MRHTWVVDVGALAIDTGEASTPYMPLLRAGRAVVIGFDPQFARFTLLPPGVRIDPRVIGDGSKQTLYVCAAPGMTSLFKANPAVTGAFHNFDFYSQIVDEKQVETHRLDDIAEVERIDWLRMDAQCAECLIMEGAGRKLAQAVVVQAEVQFVPLYQDAPMLADVDASMRSRGFHLHAFQSFHTAAIHTLTEHDVSMRRQAFSADAIYVRSLFDIDHLSDDQLEQLSVIMRECYGSIALANACDKTMRARCSDTKK